MWSHYGDEHRGLCIGYSIPDRAKVALHQVKYGGACLIATSRIAAMLGGDKKACEEVNAAPGHRMPKVISVSTKGDAEALWGRVGAILFRTSSLQPSSKTQLSSMQLFAHWQVEQLRFNFSRYMRTLQIFYSNDISWRRRLGTNLSQQSSRYLGYLRRV